VGGEAFSRWPVQPTCRRGRCGGCSPSLVHARGTCGLALQGAGTNAGRAHVGCLEFTFEVRTAAEAGPLPISGVRARPLRDADFGALAEAISANWDAQKQLHPSITTELIERAFEVAGRAGAAAEKANGAGGGGSITFLCGPGREFAVRSALSRLSGIQVLPWNITFQGAKSWRAE
jgi:hypothetical protein